MDTTVQPKAVTHQTDAKLMHKAIVMLAALAREHSVKLRQPTSGSPSRRWSWPDFMPTPSGGTASAGRLKFLRTRLGRLERDIRRKIAGTRP